MAIELATQFLPYVDEKFTTESKTSLITNNNFNWSGAHSVKVYKVSTSVMHDYDRVGSGITLSRYGAAKGLEATTEEFPLAKDRSFTFVIDKLDQDETKRTLEAASALARQLREVVIPEVDTYVLDKIVAGAGTTSAPAALTKSNIYDMIAAATETLDTAEAPEIGRVLLVPPATYTLMKKSPDIVMETNVGNELRLKGVLGFLDGATVVKVPATRLPDKVGFILAHAVATVAPVKLDDYKIHADPPGISGYLIEGRIVYDAFVLDNKKKAIYVHKTA